MLNYRSVFCIVGFVALMSGQGRAQAQDLSPGVASLLEKAKAGDVKSQFRLASAYDTGSGAPKDGREAMRWYMAAAEQGHPESQNSVGSVLQAEKRFSEALNWYEKASKQNHARATNNLAYLHDLGLGVPQDRQKAFALYSRAADLGWAEAMWNIANMYGAGQLGGPPDLVLACAWTMRAQRYARPVDRALLARAQKVMQMLDRRLGPRQTDSCHAQGESWSPSALAERSDEPDLAQ